jgi:hypothetical protein
LVFHNNMKGIICIVTGPRSRSICSNSKWCKHIIPGIDDRSEISVSGSYVQQNFKYRNQFFVTGAVRVDGSSVFGQDQRNQTYYKASGSYVISGTDFWSKMGVSKWWDLFKLRLAYGESGNLTGIGAYSRFNTYSTSSYLGRTSLNSSNTGE